MRQGDSSDDDDDDDKSDLRWRRLEKNVGKCPRNVSI